MALIYYDGFDLGSDLGAAGYTQIASMDVNVGGGRFGGNCLNDYGNTYYGATIYYAFEEPIDDFIVGCAFNAQGAGNEDLAIVTLGDVVVTKNSDNSLSVSSPEFTAKSAAGIVPTNGWFQFVLVLVPGTGTAGSYALYLNGNPTPILSGTGTATTAATSFAGITFGGSGNGRQASYDDAYVLDSTGGAPFNANMGDLKVNGYLPSATGRVNDFTNVGGSSNVVSVQSQDGDASYVSDANVGDEDCYEVALLSSQTASGTIYAVQAVAYARKDDANARSLSVGLGNGTTEDFDNGVYLDASYTNLTRYFTQNPFTDAAWALVDLASLQVCVKVIA
jgi:hypothetical protein